MARFFSNENWIWKPFDYIADVFLLSGIWFVCSLPVITIGATTTALYDCCARCVRGHDRQMFARYFRTAKREFVPATLSVLLWSAIVWLGYLLVKAYGNHVAVTDASVALTTAMLLLLTVVVGIAGWVLPLLSRFTFSIGQLQITAVKLALAHLPRTMILGIVTVLAGYLCIRFWVPFIFLPAVLGLICTWIIEPVFRAYMEEETEETE